MSGVAAERELNGFVKKALLELGEGGARAAVFLLKGREMARLKSLNYPKKSKKAVTPSEVDYVRGREGTQRASASNVVDVLAFPEPEDFPHPESRGRFIGEIYINKKIAVAEKERSRFLALHGLLHLLGYTHDKKSDTIKMQQKEVELLSKITNSKRQITNKF